MYPFVIFQKIKICIKTRYCFLYGIINSFIYLWEEYNFNFLLCYFKSILLLFFQEGMHSSASPHNFQQTSKEHVGIFNSPDNFGDMFFTNKESSIFKEVTFCGIPLVIDRFLVQSHDRILVSENWMVVLLIV